MSRITKKYSVRHIAAALVLLSCTMISQPASATENGGSSYGHGSEGFLDAFPPGLHIVDYLNYYTSSKTMDNSGNEVQKGSKVQATANIFRIMNTSTDFEILGSKVSSHILIPLVNAYVNTGLVPTGPGTFGKFSGNKTGIGDITIAPVMLGWHSKNYHLITGIDFTMPTGDYNKNDVANIGRNYWDIQPNFIATYTGDAGFQAFGKFMYDFNTKNVATGYTSGQEFHVDYGISQGVTRELQIGVGGYAYEQTTNDKADASYGKPVTGKGQVYAAGPQINYHYKNMTLDVKYQKEFEARNRTEGDKFWLKFNYSF